MTGNTSNTEQGLAATAAAGGPITMSSREIADLVEARHNDVVTTIERLFAKGVLRESRKTPRPHQPPGGGRPTDVYDLTKRDTLVVASGYDDVLRAKIIDRWMELEQSQTGTVHFLVPKSLPEALRLAADQAERIEAQKAQIQALAPKAEFHDKVTEAVNCQTVEEIAKVLGTGQNRMFAWLRDQRILMASNLPYQRFIDEGYFRTVERQYTDRRGESHTYTRTLVTGKGFAYIQKRFGEERAA